MKVSEIFSLGKSQYEIDFVDIDPSKDIPVFLDPFFISTRRYVWCIKASDTLQGFFQNLIDLIKTDQIDDARNVFIHLNEPNETCLGFSRGQPQGRGVGSYNASQIFDSLLESKAVETGLVEDLEDTAIFIDGIARDMVSDMTTNIIKKHLLDYTKDQCNLWNIPLTQATTGFYWDSVVKTWDQDYDDRLVVDGKALLLVPKIAVSFQKNFIEQKYHQHFILNFLQADHLSKGSRLVQKRRLKSGKWKEFVTKKSIKESEAPQNKEFIREFTRKHPEVFKDFKSKTAIGLRPIDNRDLDSVDFNELIDFLIKKLKETQSGSEKATFYHRLITGILELIFFPKLTNPRKEQEINEGRKRVDIIMDNAAVSGFFYNLHNIDQINCSYVFFECKNYSGDPSNPELDQLSGRLGVNTGKVGILICRSISDKKLFLKRCSDTWKQKKELIVPLTDKEIIHILSQIDSGNAPIAEQILGDLKRKIILD